VQGSLLHTATAGDDPLVDPLNDGGRGQVISGLEGDASGLSITFEDVTLGAGDGDFNDHIFGFAANERDTLDFSELFDGAADPMTSIRSSTSMPRAARSS
jgi:hypothetical protein